MKKTNVKTKRLEPIDTFIDVIMEINNRLDELKDYADNHMNYDPDEINWGHIGST